ncbi:carbohydrate kinase family protein [Roseateles violae]|uniref:PfkB family carbohydrate kinase n=1 Tax=Roseateles violae TaxID=3058042 RepID=A0ABT8DPP2_9BURK|nr:PfkB family carbohydrate kinase [Pelomonas sp. PFR6]MDN3920321.1 PfkB family carbohydrate kinase [Pelomonas sp. PFR6]
MSRPLPGFVSFGEALTDLIRVDGHHWRACDGGAPWNLARAMQGLGVSSAFAGAISTDVFGRQLRQATLDAGLDERYLQSVDKSPLLAVVHESSPPQYFFIGDDSADLHFDPSALPEGWREAISWAHFGGISLAREPLARRLLAQAESLRADGIRISYDPNFRVLMDERYDATLARMCKLADVIKVSDEDLCGLFRTTDPAVGLRTLRDWNPQAWVMVTRGEHGAELLHGTSSSAARPPAVTVVDTVGAGDASMAGLIVSMMTRTDAPPEAHLAWAMAAGAAACMQAGAATLTMDAILRLVPPA